MCPDSISPVIFFDKINNCIVGKIEGVAIEEASVLEVSFHLWRDGERILNVKIEEGGRCFIYSTPENGVYFFSVQWRCGPDLREFSSPKLRILHSSKEGYEGKKKLKKELVEESVYLLRDEMRRTGLGYGDFIKIRDIASGIFKDENYPDALLSEYCDVVLGRDYSRADFISKFAGKEKISNWSFLLENVSNLILKGCVSKEFENICLELKNKSGNCKKKVFIMSFGRSGSSAIKDYLSDYKSVSFCRGSEITIFNGGSGLRWLYENPKDWRNWLYNFLAVYGFGLGSLESKALAKEAVKSWCILHQADEDLLFKAFSLLVYDISEGSKAENFSNALKKFVDNFSDAFCSDNKKIVVFLNAINPRNSHNFNFIEDYCLIPVFRDPRCQYVDGRLTNKKDTDVKSFIKLSLKFKDRYLDSYDIIQANGFVYPIRFEDFVCDYKVRNKLLSFLGIDSDERVSFKFDPVYSSKNVRKFENYYVDFEEDFARIEKVLMPKLNYLK